MPTATASEAIEPGMENCSRCKPGHKAAAEQWLRAFALEWNMDYDNMIEAAISSGYIKAHGHDLQDASDLGDNLFWHHLETLTGQTFGTEHREQTTFTCSC